MITLLKRGKYKLIETKAQIKILILDDQDTYAWVTVRDIGEILVSSHKAHKIDHILSVGFYRLYEVKDEPMFSDHLHLELNVGLNEWQGYLLLTGLPTEVKKRNRIIPTTEIISTSL